VINLREKEKEVLNDLHVEIINKINIFFENNQGFKLQDLLEEDQSSYYYVYLTKGLLYTLIMFDYIEIFSLYNGNKNFVYRAKKKIENKFIYDSS